MSTADDDSVVRTWPSNRQPARLTLHGQKRVLAPMVRLGTLPLRVMALRHGADAVFSEEIIDRKLASCSRTRDHRLNTIDFIPTRSNQQLSQSARGGAVFRTAPEEQHAVILQLGTSNAVDALRAAEVAAMDVAGVDINMGCPKHAAMSGGMGAALLQKPETGADVLRTLRRNLPAHVHLSCKVRLLDSVQQTLESCRQMASAGAEAVSIHCRGIHESPTVSARWHELCSVVSELSPVPVLVNGSIWNHSDVSRARAASSCAGVMIGRACLGDMEIMRDYSSTSGREAGQLLTDQLCEYAKIAIRYENSSLNSRFVLQWMLNEANALFTDPRATALESATTNSQIAEAVGLVDYYNLAERRPPLAATHYYADSQTYFRTIGAPYFEEERTGHKSSQPKSNSDFRNMLQARRQRQAEAPTKKKKKRKKELINHKSLLAEELKQRRWGAARYQLLQECPPEEKAMGYFAAAFKMTVIVNGQSFDSDKFAKSKDRASHRAAYVALAALVNKPDV